MHEMLVDLRVEPFTTSKMPQQAAPVEEAAELEVAEATA
jgi:hypothetical protein